MSAFVLLDVIKLEHEERIRKAERDRMFIDARRADERPSALKSLLQSLRRS